MRSVLLALALLAAAPATASAALGQVEPLKVADERGLPRATGRPGEISAPVSGGVRFLVATREGFEPGGLVKFDGELPLRRRGGPPERRGRHRRPHAYIAAVEGERRGLRRGPPRSGGTWGAAVPLPARRTGR